MKIQRKRFNAQAWVADRHKENFGLPTYIGEFPFSTFVITKISCRIHLRKNRDSTPDLYSLFDGNIFVIDEKGKPFVLTPEEFEALYEFLPENESETKTTNELSPQ